MITKYKYIRFNSRAEYLREQNNYYMQNFVTQFIRICFFNRYTSEIIVITLNIVKTGLTD